VFVDSNYHSTAESRMLWPRTDGVCRWCPLLYVPFQGARKQVCPAASVKQCFDDVYTCERCCNVQKYGPRGDMDCWRRNKPFSAATRLESGTAAYEIPEEVLQRIIESAKSPAEILTLIGPEAWPTPSPKIFSYEMCCAGMVGEFVPGLAPYFHSQHQGEYFSQEKQAAQPPKEKVEICANFGGTYE
ncbi:unnamed protein product, partial [Effrenium voratum]